MLFGGFFVNASNIPKWLSWLGYASYFKYTIEIVTFNEFSGAVYTCPNVTFYFGCDPATNTFQGDEFLKSLGFDSVILWKNFVILLSMVFIYKLLAFLAIYFFHKEER